MAAIIDSLLSLFNIEKKTSEDRKADHMMLTCEVAPRQLGEALFGVRYRTIQLLASNNRCQDVSHDRGILLKTL